MTALALSRVLFPVTTLGPGRRVGIWFQGCSIRCPGCISVDTWPAGEPTVSIADLLDALAPWLNAADGVTITGGEPFDQLAALEALLAGIRERFPGDILVYSGYPFEALTGALERLTGLMDALISDPYESAAGDRLALRGSDNQRLHPLTPLGRSRFKRFDAPGEKCRSLDLMMDADGCFWLAGIPRRGDFTRLRQTLELHGHQALTSQHREGS
jgi:anaerobic ribonucleoside-triphosphate reductase activating protein